VFFEQRLWRPTSRLAAHAAMLARQGVIASRTAADPQGPGAGPPGIESGAFEWKLDLEDVHLNIEARLNASWSGDAGQAPAHRPQPQRPGRPPTCACGCAARST
jgi:argininosuccinate lyase